MAMMAVMPSQLKPPMMTVRWEQRRSESQLQHPKMWHHQFLLVRMLRT